MTLKGKVFELVCCGIIVVLLGYVLFQRGQIERLEADNASRMSETAPAFIRIVDDGETHPWRCQTEADAVLAMFKKVESIGATEWNSPEGKEALAAYRTCMRGQFGSQ